LKIIRKYHAGWKKGAGIFDAVAAPRKIFSAPLGENFPLMLAAL
jgi:hypothetical protein